MKAYLPLFYRRILNTHHKINSIALASIFLPVLSFVATPVMANDFVMEVKTKISVFYDGKTESYYTETFNVGDALVEHSIYVAGKDVVMPSSDTKLKGGDISVEIKRALPLLLNDNGNERIIFSGYDDITNILGQNEVTVYPEDRIVRDLILDFYKAGSLGLKITIERAPVVYVNVDGGKQELRSWKKTVSEILTEKNILVGDKDKVSPGRHAGVSNNMEIVITRVAESEVKDTEIINYKTKTIEDNNMYVGKSYVKQKGKSGKKELTYKIISEDGMQVDKILMNSTIVEDSVDKIIVKGVKPYKASHLWDIIVVAAGKHGVSASKMYNVMMCESGGNPYSTSSTGHYGLFQYSLSTWSRASSGAGYSGASVYDPEAQIYVTAWKVNNDGGWGAWKNCANKY